MRRETKQEKLSRVGALRGLPDVKIGDRVAVAGRQGVIAGANNSANFDVRFDDNGQVGNCHPGWKFEMLPEAEPVS